MSLLYGIVLRPEFIDITYVLQGTVDLNFWWTCTKNTRNL